MLTIVLNLTTFQEPGPVSEDNQNIVSIFKTNAFIL